MFQANIEELQNSTLVELCMKLFIVQLLKEDLTHGVALDLKNKIYT
jgi:hypothetical protein